MSTVSVIMPALNEEANIKSAIEHTLSAFDELSIDGDILVVNDGSTDQTPAIVKTLIAENPEKLTMIEHKKPLGIGKSFWDGVTSASGELVVMFPGDDENEPREVLRYIRLLNEVDFIVPYIYNKNVRSPLRNGISWLFRSIINLLFGTTFRYTNGTVLYRKNILSGLDCKSTGFFYQAEILIKASKAGYLFSEVPTRLASRKSGDSKAVSIGSLCLVCSGCLNLFCEIYFKRTSSARDIHRDSATWKRLHANT